jgi:hypothetical protein
MKKLGTIFLFSIVSTIAMASTRDAIDSAEKLCGTMYPAEKQIQCMEVVSKVKYLDEEGVRTCGKMYPADKEIECLRAIANNEYTEAKMKMCSDMYPSDKAIDCFKRVGKPQETSVQVNPLIRQQLLRVREYLNDGNVFDAKRVVNNLLNLLEN